MLITFSFRKLLNLSLNGKELPVTALDVNGKHSKM